MNPAAVLAVHEFVSDRARYARSEADRLRAELDRLGSRSAGASEAWLAWNDAEVAARKAAAAYVESLADVAALDVVVDLR